MLSCRASASDRARCSGNAFLQTLAFFPLLFHPGEKLRDHSEELPDRQPGPRTLLWTQLVLNEPVEGEKVLSGGVLGESKIENPEKVPDTHLYF